MPWHDFIPDDDHDLARTASLPAKAAVVNGELKVWSDKVKEPTIVRYGWQPFTRANLVNGAGLPASTFRSDVK